MRSTKDSIGSIYIEKNAEGNSFIDAKDRAEGINYDFTFDNNTLILDGHFTTSIENKFREQEIKMTN